MMVAFYWEKAAHSAYNMFSKYKYLILNLVFSNLGFWSGDFFQIAPFPDHCLHVTFYTVQYIFVLCSNGKKKKKKKNVDKQ